MNLSDHAARRSWVSVTPDCHFPIQNLPYGTMRRAGEAHAGVAIGEYVFDLTLASREGLLPHKALFAGPDLNAFAAAGPAEWDAARERIGRLLSEDEPTVRDDARLRDVLLVPRREVTMLLPVSVGDYTDFYSSKEHATNVGTMLRGAENALMPNWVHLPVAYHGRASSVVVSGTDVRRPLGQSRPDPAAPPVFGATKSLDYELEMAAIVGPGNEPGEPVAVGSAEDHLFGLVLLNDWSARDVQAWEYQPLGPFLAKNFATSISPWVVPLEALEPFRKAGPTQEPDPLPYLRQHGKATFDIRLEVVIAPRDGEPTTVCVSNFSYLYWSLAQQVAHHTINGCPLRPGDLLASGTISGPTPESAGCLLERTWRGTKPISLSGGVTRRFLEDGDRVTMTAWCQGDGYRVGFGEVTGVVVGARNEPEV
jgi:fumarylacetoacetase